MASMAAKNDSWCVGVVSVLEPSPAGAVRRSGHAAAGACRLAGQAPAASPGGSRAMGPGLAPREVECSLRPAQSAGGCAVSGLLPGLHPVPVAARGGAQLELGIEPGRARLGHEREQLRPDVADAVRL